MICKEGGESNTTTAPMKLRNADILKYDNHNDCYTPKETNAVKSMYI